MRNDFKPVHLQKVNRELDALELSSARSQKQDDVPKDESTHNVSLWKKFLGLFRSSSSEFPEDLYK